MVTYNLKLLGTDLLKLIDEQVLLPRFMRRDLIDEPFLHLGKEVTLSRPIHPEGRLYPGHGPFYPQSTASYTAKLERHPYIYLPVKNFFAMPLTRLQEESIYPIAEIFAHNMESYFLDKTRNIPNLYPTDTHSDISIDTIQGIRSFEEHLGKILNPDMNYNGIVTAELAETLSLYTGNDESVVEDDHLGEFMGVDWYYSPVLDSTEQLHTTGTVLRGEINGDKIHQSTIIPLKNVVPSNGTFKKHDTLLLQGIGSIIVAEDTVATNGYADVPVMSAVVELVDGTDVRLYDGGGYTYKTLGIVFNSRTLTCVSAVLDQERIPSTNFLADQIEFFSYKSYGLRIALQQEYQNTDTAVLFADTLFGGSISEASSGVRIVRRIKS